jgi:hypothetical protein
MVVFYERAIQVTPYFLYILLLCALEYTQFVMRLFCGDHGIIHQTTCAHMSQ